MSNSEMTQTVCGGLVGLLLYVAFFLMFGRAILKSDLIFHGGRIHGRLARIIGVIGLLGITAGAYLAISVLVFKTEPPFASVALVLFGVFIVVAISVRALSIFFWH